MPFSTRTVLLSGVGLALFGGLAYISFRTNPVPVDLAEVTQGHFEVTINADGFTRVRELYEIASPITGTALRSPVEAGDPVIRQDTVVAVVEPVASDLLDARTRRETQAALDEANAALNVAEADYQSALEQQNFAQSQFDRTQSLVSRGAISVTQLEDASQRLAVAKAGVQAAQARIDMARGQINRTAARLAQPENGEELPESCCIRLTSPIDGVVLSVDRISRRPVLAGAPLVSIGDPRDLELVADILSSDAVRLSTGAPAYVERWGGDTPLMAELDRIDPRARTKISALGIEEQRVDAYFSLTGALEDRPALGDGFSVFLRVVEWQADDAVNIPLSALFRDGDGWAVFVASDKTASERPVTVGRRNERSIVILSGLEPGEQVITHPSDAITDGVRITERSEL